MQDALKPALDAGTIRSMAAEEVRIALTPAEIEALVPLLDSLLEEIRAIAPGDRAGAEPEPSITVEEWQK